MCFLSWFKCSCNRGVCMHGACMMHACMHTSCMLFSTKRAYFGSRLSAANAPARDGPARPIRNKREQTFGSLAPPPPRVLSRPPSSQHQGNDFLPCGRARPSDIVVRDVRGVDAVHIHVGRPARLGPGVPRVRLPSQEEALREVVGEHTTYGSPGEAERRPGFVCLL